MAVRLESAGVDLIELSGGTYESMAFSHKKDSTKKREAFFIEYVYALFLHLATPISMMHLDLRSAFGPT